jgi:hypothetical protein
MSHNESSTRRVAPVPKIVFNHAEGAPGPSLLGTGEVSSLITAAGCPMSLQLGTWDTTTSTLLTLALADVYQMKTDE